MSRDQYAAQTRSPAFRMAVFDRIGDSHDVEPLTLTGDDRAEWCAQVEWYSRRFLGSRDVVVGLFPYPPIPEGGAITVASTGANVGTFRIEAVR